MIFDKRENALTYLGISPQLDAALRFVYELKPEALPVNTRVPIDGDRAYANVGEPVCQPRPMRFEFHKKMIDIHVPVTGVEMIALTDTAAAPSDTVFDAENDVGFFEADPALRVRVPAGWFCLCFPQDAHVPCLAPEERAIMKVVVKVQAK